MTVRVIDFELSAIEIGHLARPGVHLTLLFSTSERVGQLFETKVIYFALLNGSSVHMSRKNKIK